MSEAFWHTSCVKSLSMGPSLWAQPGDGGAQVEVTTPEEHMGDVIGDLNSRRGLVGEFLDKPGNMRVRSLSYFERPSLTAECTAHTCSPLHQGALESTICQMPSAQAAAVPCLLLTLPGV